MSDPLLVVERLCVERGGRVVLADLSFTLAAGEAILVSGRNGAGKSTLLRAISGLLPPKAGAIRFGLLDEEVRGVETAHYLGYEDALKPTLSVRENLEFWRSMLRGGSSPAQRGRGTARSVVEGAPDTPLPRVGEGAPPPPSSVVPLPRVAGEDHGPEAALAALGIGRLLDLPAGYLSAGQKRRVALARLLVASRPIWLLDEPLIALDTGAQALLTGLMSDHLAQGGAILVASHQALTLPHREIDLARQQATA